MNNQVSCPICKVSMALITASHLKKHKLAFSQFRLQFPTIKTQSESVCSKKRIIGIKYRDLRAGEKIKKYLINPSRCENCGDILPYDRLDRQFCLKPVCKFSSRRSEIYRKKVRETGSWRKNPNWLNHSQSPKSRCFRSEGEMKLKQYIITQFPNFHWSSGGGFVLETGVQKCLDIFCREIKVMIEYDGIWHFQDIRGDLKSIQEKDKLLEIFCEKNNWKLIRVNERTIKELPSVKDEICHLIQHYQTLPAVTKLYHVLPEL